MTPCPRWPALLTVIPMVAGCASPPGASAPAPAPILAEGVRIDPMMLVSAAEVRRLLAAIGDSIYPGLSRERVPMLLYRPRVQDVLIDFPTPPAGFRPLRVPQLAGASVHVRDDTTFIDIDDQNTTRLINGVNTLVVADQYSRMRSQIRAAVLQRPADMAQRWLEAWNFVPSAYDELQTMLHEIFHVVQERRAPGKMANEGAVARYPVLDSLNNALVALEGQALRDALLAREAAGRREFAARFIALRAARRARLDTASIAWEDLNEFREGTGRYVEYRFLRAARGLEPLPEMFLRTGFRGYGAVLDTLLVQRLAVMVAVAAGGDAFTNPFGGGPARYRTYEMGAAQGLLLDELGASWKERIFEPGVSLTSLIVGALSLTSAEVDRALADAKRAYRFDSTLAAKGAFERQGRAVVAARVDSIRNQGASVVTVAYERAGRIGMAYTPFGVTAISAQAAIYDQVPLRIHFENGSDIEMKEVVAVILDRNARTLTFASRIPAEAITQRADGSIDTDQFRVTGALPFTLTRNGREVRIQYR